MSGRATIIGAGQIGIACANHLLSRGWAVDLLSRTAAENAPPAARLQIVDRRDSSALSAAAYGGELLVDTIAFDAPDAAQLVKLSDRYDAVAAISSASVYRDAQGRTLDEARESGFPENMRALTHNCPTVAPGPATYSTRKVAMEQTLLAGASGKAIVIRPCAIHGPFSRHPREWWFVKRILDGRTAIPLAFGGASRFQTTSVAAIARLVEEVAQSEGVFNCADSDSPTVLDIGNAIARHLGAVPEFVLLDRITGSVGRTPWSVPSPFTIANDPKQNFARTYVDEVGSAVEWLVAIKPADWRTSFPQLAAYPWALFDYEVEDNAIGNAARS